MTARSMATLIARFVVHSRGHFVFAGVGLVVGTATLAFFLSLSLGVREKVLNRLYPVNQAELQVETIKLFGLGLEVPARLDQASLTALERLPGVAGVFPKQRSKFQAKLWGGRDVLGEEAHVEAFFDGLDPALVRDELRAAEAEVLGPETGGACARDGDCPAGGRCDAGTCRRAGYWNSFRDSGTVIACRTDDQCAPGSACSDGRCRVPCGEGCGPGRTCAGGECLAACTADGECEPGEVCGEGACRRLACKLSTARVQFGSDWEALRGFVVGAPPGATAPERCPQGTYCAAANVLRADGFCEAPIPAVLSPFLLEIYNSVATTALGLRRLAGLEVVLGVRFAMLFGESYFVGDTPVETRMVRRCRAVGFTAKAMEFGVTLPLPYVVRINAAMKGRDEAAQFTSVVVETTRNEHIPAVIEDAKVLGLTLAPRSEEGRKAANVLLILTLVFAMVSLVILAISAINITHTFLMLVTERRVEIAVYRAVGATLLDIRLLVLGEAAGLGFVGGAVGCGAAWAASRAVNVLAAGVLERVPGSPSDLFVFPPWIFAACIGCAVVFSLIGAHLPARAAARMDPATVLAQG